MKLCKDCKHFQPPAHGLSIAEYGKCRAPRIMVFSPVTGEKVPKFSEDFAVTLRRGANRTNYTKDYCDEHWCGPDGAWFEPKDAQPAPAEACSEVGHEETRSVIQTCCKHCGLDIEGLAPFRRGEWRDRGNNSTCNNGEHKHAPRYINGIIQ